MTAPTPNDSIVQLVGLASGEPTAFDGQYLVEYDPTRPGRDPQGREMLAHVVTTPDPAQARRFADAAEVHAVWTASSGLPYPRNAPLTAYTIAVLPVALSEYAVLGRDEMAGCEDVAVVVDHGPVKPPYGTAERADWDSDHAFDHLDHTHDDVPPNAGSAS